MKKKLLSVALVLSMVLSLLMVGITGPVSAAKDTYLTQEATYDRAIDLSKELTPSVNLTFDGKAPYGIPYGRFSSAQNTKYQNDSLWLQGPGGNGFWVFFGEDGTVGETTISYTGASSVTSAHAEAVSKLYTFKSGNTYTVTFNMKAARNSTAAANNTIVFGTSPDPSNASLSANQNADRMTVISQSGFTLEYKVDGEVQTSGALAKDSDWQTATVTFTANKDVKFGICTKLSGTNIYVDNVKIYNHDEYYDSKFQNKLTFDNGGLGVKRYVTNFAIANENGNGYCIIDDTGNSTGSAYFASCEDSALYNAISGEYKNGSSNPNGLSNIAKAYKKMFKFESGESYEVTFKYKYASTTNNKADTALVLRLMADPAGVNHTSDELLGTDSWAKDILCTGVSTPNELGVGVWQEVKVTFTVKTKDETTRYAVIRPSGTDTAHATYSDQYNLTIDKTGAYFGIKCPGQIVHIDDYEVKKLVNYRLLTLQTDTVYHDMENDTIATNKTGSIGEKFIMNKGNDNNHTNKNTTFADSNDGTEHGKVLKMTGSDQVRGTFGDAGVFEKGRKYYISFDARSNSGSAQEMWLSLANLSSMNSSGTLDNNFAGSQQEPRLNFSATAANTKFKYYINGAKIEKYADFAKLGTEWQRYGIVIDFTDESITSSLENISFTANNVKYKFFDAPKYFYFGTKVANAECWFDNFRITAVNTMDDAVPTSDISYISKEVYHDMETYGGFYERVEGKAHIVNSHDKKYGNVMEITSGGQRIGFTDSNIITKDKKYYISFDAKTTNNTSRYMWLMVCTTSTTTSPRFIISDTTHQNKNDGSADDKGATNINIAENGNAFRYYIDDKEVHRDDFKLSGDWRKYTLVIDTSDPDLIAKSNANSGEIKNLLSGDAKYFYFGTENAWFDNFRMVEVSETAQTISKEDAIYGTEVSYREAGTSVNGEYISAGLRFKAKLPSGIVSEADEIGFVAAPSSLARDTAGWYKLENGVNSIARTALVKDNIRNYVYATDGDNTYYHLVFNNLSTEDGKTAYNRRFSAVLYVKIGDKYTYYPLGEASYHQVVGIENFLSFNEKKLDVETMASNDYKVVYNAEEYNTWVVKNQINKLCDSLNSKEFGIDKALECRADITLDASDYEIIIGNTNRGTVGNVSALSNKNNYAIRISGSKVYVMAGSTYALQSAIYELETMVTAGKITEKEGSYLDTAVIDSTSEYKLVWQSEFDDPKTVTYNSSNMASIKNWWVDPIDVNSKVNETKIYNSQAFLVSDKETVLWDDQGHLILRATRKDNSTIKYDDREDWSGNSNLKYKHQGGIHCNTMEFNYGYVEMRARIPDGKGIYSSFWLNGLSNGTTPEVEIDIFESGGVQAEFDPNIHWWGLDSIASKCDPANKDFFEKLLSVRGASSGSISYNQGTPTSYEWSEILTNYEWYQTKKTWVDGYGKTYNKYYPKPTKTEKTMVFSEPNKLYNEWHTIGLLWTDEVLEFYCDGILYHSRDIKDFKYPDGTHAFDNQFENIIGGFNLGWNGRTSPTEDATDPSYPSWEKNADGIDYLNYYIDYFRLYQIDKNWRPCTDYK